MGAGRKGVEKASEELMSGCEECAKKEVCSVCGEQICTINPKKTTKVCRTAGFYDISGKFICDACYKK